DGRTRGHPVAQGERVAQRLLRVGGKMLGVVVPESHQRRRDLGAVRRLPEELHLAVTYQLVAASHDGVIYAEAPENLRHLRQVAELVGQIADLHARAELAGDAMADEQAAHGRLAAGQELVVQLIPGADGDTPFPDVLFQPGAVLRLDGEVVLQHDGLRVQVEITIVRVAVEQGKDVIYQVYETHSELLERQIPLPIPVRMRD